MLGVKYSMAGKINALVSAPPLVPSPPSNRDPFTPGKLYERLVVFSQPLAAPSPELDMLPSWVVPSGYGSAV